MANGKEKERLRRLVFVIAGSPMENLDFLKSQIAELNPAELVCADGGARHLDKLGLTPHVIIGDMDSLSAGILKRYEEQGTRIVRHPRDKKETDTQLALEYAMESVPDEIRIFGALGGRIDHTLANISLLVRSAERNVPAKLVDGWCEVFVVTRHAELEGIAGQTVSLFPLASEVCGIELRGFEYPLAGATMKPGAPYGISNRLVAEKGSISIESGCLLVIRYHRPGVFPGGT